MICKRSFVIFIFILLVLAGCGGKALDGTDEYISSIQEMELPTGVRVIGLGEATHGNVELQQLKKMSLRH